MSLTDYFSNFSKYIALLLFNFSAGVTIIKNSFRIKKREIVPEYYVVELVETAFILNYLVCAKFLFKKKIYLQDILLVALDFFLSILILFQVIKSNKYNKKKVIYLTNFSFTLILMSIFGLALLKVEESVQIISGAKAEETRIDSIISYQYLLYSSSFFHLMRYVAIIRENIKKKMAHGFLACILIEIFANISAAVFFFLIKYYVLAAVCLFSAFLGFIVFFQYKLMYIQNKSGFYMDFFVNEV